MAGAAGLRAQRDRRGDLVADILRWRPGGSLLDPAITQRVLDRMRNGAEDDARWPA